MRKKIAMVTLIIFILIPKSIFAMHITEGFLPLKHAIAYTLVSLPYIYIGIRDIRKKIEKNINIKMFIALAGAYCFLLSALKLPSVTGSSSHPTGIGFGTVLLGPYIMTVVGFIVLLFQSLFLAHGGITTLGANVFSMAIIGPFASIIIYKIFKNINKKGAIFLAAALGNFMTYATTSVQLAIAHPSEIGGIGESIKRFGTILAVTQIPLAIAEGLMTVILFNLLEQYLKQDVEKIMEAAVNEK